MRVYRVGDGEMRVYRVSDGEMRVYIGWVMGK